MSKNDSKNDKAAGKPAAKKQTGTYSCGHQVRQGQEPFMRVAEVNQIGRKLVDLANAELLATKKDGKMDPMTVVVGTGLGFLSLLRGLPLEGKPKALRDLEKALNRLLAEALMALDTEEFKAIINKARDKMKAEEAEKARGAGSEVQ